MSKLVLAFRQFRHVEIFWHFGISTVNIEELPFAASRVELEIRGVSTAVINALRRVVMDEMPGYALCIPDNGLDFRRTDPLMMQYFVELELNIPLKPKLSETFINEQRFSLNVTNPHPNKSIYVLSQHLEPDPPLMELIFNPTFPIAALQPSKSIIIKDIYIGQGIGRKDAKYHVACRSAHTHLDIKEYSLEEITEAGGLACRESGYKESSLISNPRHHKLTLMVRATSAKKYKEECRFVLISYGIKYRVFPYEDASNGCTLQVPEETHTIGNLIQKTVFEQEKGKIFVKYEVLSSKNMIELTIRYVNDIIPILIKAIQQCIQIFDIIQQGIQDSGVPKHKSLSRQI
ncbi:hypothetical protein C1645_835143 [Glomus cerebriforme]|uniref:DNA-directed RNA polymerase RpoA/D/Rpb3-type domain-containing protein n=1 Tax=Glomus cerebriforme TaxID=658196 RepID=A0A397SIH2_9GLOM|nr:hypothetical protein C1645_835143 [Glomus cerebriforme]